VIGLAQESPIADEKFETLPALFTALKKLETNVRSSRN
jgi:hypothetical protein